MTTQTDTNGTPSVRVFSAPWSMSSALLGQLVTFSVNSKKLPRLPSALTGQVGAVFPLLGIGVTGVTGVTRVALPVGVLR